MRIWVVILWIRSRKFAGHGEDIYVNVVPAMTQVEAVEASKDSCPFEVLNIETVFQLRERLTDPYGQRYQVSLIPVIGRETR